MSESFSPRPRKNKPLTKTINLAMLIKIRKSRWAKIVVAFLIVFMFMPMQFPLSALALSGGPNPPEYSTFQKVSPGNMVDPFTGNVQYSVPLFEIGGYPINLTYSGDIHPEQNAGWVGLGWSLQAGSIGRAVRGLPDDFKGDKVEQEVKQKPRKIHTFNFQYQNKAGKQVELAGLKGGIGMNGLPTITHDNYRGFGINYDVNMHFKIPGGIDSIFSDTSGWAPPLQYSSVWQFVNYDTTYKEIPILDFNTQYSSTEGNSYEVVPSPGYIQEHLFKKEKEEGKKLNILLSSPSIRFSSEQGLQSLGMSHGRNDRETGRTRISNYSANFQTIGFVPTFNPDRYVSVWETALDLSGDWLFHDARAYSMGFTKSVEGFVGEDNAISQTSKEAYGYLYNGQAEGLEDVLTDYQTGNKILNKYSQSLSPTVASYDVFNISASGVGGSFKVKYNSLGILSPPTSKVSSVSNKSISSDLGGGTNAEIGANLGIRHILKRTGKWEKQNEAAEFLGFKEQASNDLFEEKSLRNSFEFIQSNNSYNQQIGGDVVTSFGLKKTNSTLVSGWKANKTLRTMDADVTTLSADVFKQERDGRQQLVTYLTAKEAKAQGVNKAIEAYRFVEDNSGCQSRYAPIIISSGGNNHHLQNDGIDRDKDYRKDHHISEINVLQPSGVLYNFGLPVYQANEHHVSMAMDMDAGHRTPDYYSSTTNYQVTGSEAEDSITNVNGIDHHYRQSTTPAHATTFLLTNILSQDYSDLTGNGPSTDDLGTYVKFNYGMPDYQSSNTDPEHHLFNWTAPYKDANLARGYQSDNLDDRANFSYGKREQWHMHSIETKDRIVLFELADRADGYETNGRHGNIKTDGKQQKYLAGITIYNRSEFERLGDQADPIQQIKFDYSYELCKGITSYSAPSDTTGCGAHPLRSLGGQYTTTGKYSTGKLTLHKVEFISGSLGMVSQPPYIFEYNTRNPDYAYGSVDRWGTYHPVNLYSPTYGNLDELTTLADRPYTYQNQDSLDGWSSAWMLSDITVPSGSKISLEYEADDYAYVQDKEALSMLQVNSLRFGKNSTDLNTLYGDDEGLEIEVGNSDVINLGDAQTPNRYITFEMESGKTHTDYVPQGDIIFFSFNVNLAKRGQADAFEQVSGFFTIESSGDIAGTNLGYIKVKPYDLSKLRPAVVHPVTKMAWQYAFSNLPHLMNPKGYTNRSDLTEKMEDVVNQATGIIPEYVKSLTGAAAYYQALGYAQEVNLDKSFLRLLNPNKIKLGGGHRVAKVSITDNWSQMRGGKEVSSTYSTSYSYTTKEGDTDISSGVAIYEPLVGGEENALVMPVQYAGLKDVYLRQRSGPMAPVTVSYDMGPIGHEFYPAAGVGYSKVTVKSDAPHADIVKHLSGRTEYEFYTAKDFPTISKVTPIDKQINRFAPPGQRWDNIRTDEEIKADGSKSDPDDKGKKVDFEFGLDVRVNLGFAAAVQGYLIEQNDMHGKAKSVKTFKPNGDDPISATTYHYKTDRLDGTGNLVNEVLVLKNDGTHEQMEMGVQIDPTIFAYRTVEINQDGAIAPEYNMAPAIPVFSMFGTYAMYSNDSRVMVMTKQVFRNGILDRVEQFDKGAHTFAQNLAWDGLTGKVVLSSSKDEFNDYIYSLSKPAYWMNPSLEGAYKNIGLEITVQPSGAGIQNPLNALMPADVLVKSDFSTSDKYWVLDIDKANGLATLIDKDGNAFVPTTGAKYKVLRSGHKNLLHLGAETVVLKNNPINKTTGRWDEASTWDKVISASAIDYNDKRHLLHHWDYCFESDCNTITYNTLSGDETAYGYEFWNSGLYDPSFGHNLETLETGPGGTDFYGKPTSCTCAGETGPYSCAVCYDKGHGVNDNINPYVFGIRGIWRPSSEIIYYEKQDNYVQRTQEESTQGNANTTNIRHAGYLQNYQPYWSYNQSTSTWDRNFSQSISNPWTWKDSVTKTDIYGNDLETVSALNGIKNSVLYDYQRKLPVATAANAAYHEVLFDGFEDYSKDARVELVCDEMNTLTQTNVDSCWQAELCDQNRHWQIAEALIGGTNRISDQHAHTGNQSLMIGLGETKIDMVNHDRSNYFSLPTGLQTNYSIQSGDFAQNFYLRPPNNQEYIISVWVKEAFNGQFELKLDDIVGQPITLTQENAKVYVNGWVKLDYRFALPANGQLGDLFLVNNHKQGQATPAPCYIDDIMIFPADAVMTAYVYDRDKKRLMAGLSANNFATYYEYDEEGKMVRQKVETDRGIMTVSESRSSLKK